MSLIRKLAVLGAAAEAARRYAKKNPEKARELTDKAASFADSQTKGRYRNQIESAKRKLADVGGFSGGNPVVADAEVISSTEQPRPYKRT